MSTDGMIYLAYMSTWDSESEENIDKIINEHQLFIGLGGFSSDGAVEAEFDVLTGLATTVRDETLAADAAQIAADAAAVAALWSFGFGMVAFLGFEAASLAEKKLVSTKSKELNKKLTTVDADISARISKRVNDYIVQYKANNEMIALKGTIGLDTRKCRSFLMQFMAHVHRDTGKLDFAVFQQYALSARTLYNGPEIQKVYDALDQLNLSAKSDADVRKFLGLLKSLDFDRTQLLIVLNLSFAIMAFKMGVANTTIADCAEEAGIEGSEVGASAFEMMDAVGKFAAVVVVALSVVDIVFEVLDIVHVVEQTKTMCEKLDGPIKEGYKSYFKGIREASKQYNTAIAGSAKA